MVPLAERSLITHLINSWFPYLSIPSRPLELSRVPVNQFYHFGSRLVKLQQESPDDIQKNRHPTCYAHLIKGPR